MRYPATAVRRIARILNGGTPTPDKANWGGDVPWATPVDVGAHHGRRISKSLRNLTEAGAQSGSAIAPADSIILSTRAPIGYVARNEVAMAFNQGCKALLPNTSVDAQFLSYALQHCADEMVVLGQGSTFAELSGSALAGLKIPLPSQIDEQRQIAEYLDRETGQIDALIAKQEQLVETLTERRQAVIAQAVTRGLDPAVELKDSESAALGWVPTHWVSSRLKNVIASQTSGTSVNASDIPAEAGDVGVLKTSSVSTGRFKPQQNKTVLSEEKLRLRCPVEAGTILVNRANSPAYVGAAVYVDRNVPQLFLSDKLWQITCRKVDSKFLAWWMQTKQYRDQVGFGVVGTSSSMQNLAYEDFREIRVAIPGVEEQCAIGDYIDSATSTIDALIAKAREMTVVLRERRQALISAAVTGKIDVRGL